MKTFLCGWRLWALLLAWIPSLSFATATINLSFSPATINPGDPSTMAVTLFNSSVNALSGAAVTLNLASGVTIASVPNASNGCAFSTVSAPANGTTVTLSGGTVPMAISGGPDGSCTFSVAVNSVSTGNHTTTIPANGPSNGFIAGGSTPGFSATDNGTTVTNATAASATLAVNTLTNPTGSLSYSPSTVFVGEGTTLTITLNNPNASVNLPLTSLTHALPAGMVIATTPAASTTCSGATLSSPNGAGASVVAGDTSITLTGGTIAAGGNCRFSVALTAPVTSGTGSVTGSVAANGIGNSRGLNSNAFSSTLNLSDPVSVSQSTNAGGTVRAGQPVTLTLTITNGSSANALNITNFTDNLAAGLVLNASVTPTVSCTGAGAGNGTLTATAGAGALTLAGAVAGPSGRCTITVGVSANAAGSFSSTSVTTSPGSQMSNAAVSPSNLKVPSSSTSLTAASGLTVSKSVSPTNPYAGQAVTYTITITNWSAGALSNVNFTDNLPLVAGNQMVLSSGSLGAGCGGSALSAGAGASSATWTGGTVAAGSGTSAGTCTITLNATMPAAANVGDVFTNTLQANTAVTATDINANSLSNPSAASAAATAKASMSVSQSFTSTTITQGGTSNLKVFFNNPTATDITNTSFTDVLDTNLKITSPVSITSTGCTGSTPVLTANAGASSFSVSGLTVPANSNNTCYVQVSVTSTVVSLSTRLNATIAANNVSNDQGLSNSTAVVASTGVRVNSAISATKQFSPTSVGLNGISRVTINIANGSTMALTNLSLTDPMQSGANAFVVANSPNVSTTCGAGASVTALAGGTSVSMSGGTLAASSSCSLSFDVRMTSGSSWTNTIAGSNTSGSITSAEGAYNTANVTASASNALTASAAFSPSSTALGGTSRLSITFSNSGAVPFTNLALSPAMQTGANAFVLASPPNASSTCAGNPSIVATSGGTSLSMSGATLAAGASCVLSFDVITTAGGPWTYTLPSGAVTTAELATNGGSTTANLSKLTGTALSINKSFNPVSIVGGNPSVLRIDLTNSNSFAVNNVTLTDVFPTGMLVHSVPGTTTNCTNAVISAATDATQLGISKVDMGAGTTCYVTVNVTSIKPLNLTNTIAIGALSSNQGLSNSAATSASLSTLQGVGVQKGFNPTAVAPGQTSRLTVKLVSTLNTLSLSNVAVTDSLPAGVVIAATPNLASTCNTSPTATAGGSSVSISGVALAAQANCTFSVDVSAASVGTYVNMIPVSGVTSSEGYANQTAASATLTVASAPTVSVAYGVASIQSGGSTTLTTTVTNTSTQALSGVALTNSLPAGLTVGLTPGASTSCSGAAITAAASSSSISISGATLAAGASCTFVANVTSNTPATYVDNVSIGAVASTQGLTNTVAATATLTVLQLPTVSQALSLAAISPGGTTVWTVSLGNANAAAISLSSALVISLPTLPGNLLVAASPGLSKTCPGTVTANAGSGSLSYASGAAVPAGGCTISVNLTATPLGSYTIPIPAGALQTSAGNSQLASSVMLTVTNTTPPVANNFTATMSNTVASAQAIGPMTGSASAPATLQSYTIRSVPLGTYGTLYCNAVAVTTVPLTCGASQLSFMPASNALGVTAMTYTVRDSNGVDSSTATGTITITAPAAWSITKTHSGSLTAGSTGSYTITVSNSGASATAASTVTVSDTPPTGMTVTGMSGTGWTCAGTSCTRSDSLVAGASYPSITVAVSIASNAATPLVNSTTVSGGGVASSATATDSTTIVQPAAFRIDKSATASVLTGGGITYTVTLTNIGGTISGTSATVLDALPAGVTVTAVTPGSGVTTVSCANYTSPFTCTVTLSAGLAVNGTASFSYTATAPGTAGTVVNKISVDPTGGTNPQDPTQTCTPATACSNATTSVNAVATPAAWSINKAHTGTMTAGATGSYTITVTNSGGSPSAASTVTVSDTPPTGMTITGMSGTNWTCADNSGWSCIRSDALASGASYETITVAVSIASNATTPLVNSTTVSGGGVASSATATDSTTIVQAPAFKVEKTATASVQTGATITYTITLSNIGGSTSGTSATVKDVLPAGVSVTAVTPGSGVGGVSCGPNFNSPLVCTVTLSAGLAVTGTASFSYTATAPGTAGTVTNVISVDPTGGSSPQDPTQTCTPTTACASASTTVTSAVVPPAFQISKVGPTTVAAGASMSYTITLSNIGGSTSGTSATVKDVLPAGMSVTAVTPGSGVGGVSCGANFNSPLVCTVTLSAGLAVTGTASFSYTATAPGTAGTVTNVISVDPTGGSSPQDPTQTCTPTTACASVSTTVVAPDVYTSISAPSVVANGAVANLVLTFGNQGAVAAQGVSYQLTLPNTVTGVSCGAATCSFNGTTGVLTLTGLPSVLVPGQQLSVNVSYRAPATGNTALSATTLITTSTADETPTNNNSANAVTTLTAVATQADPTAGLRVPATAYPGSPVAVDVSYTNLGADNATGVGFAVSGFPNTGAPALSYNGIVCTWNQATGAVTGCGLPTTLPVGQTIALRASYAAPASGSVTLTSTVSSTSADANNGNNTATATTTVVTQPAAPLADVTTTVSVPSQADGGTTVLVPLVYQNLGPASATGVSYTVTLTGGASNAQISYNGVQCTYSGGSISGCNLPTTLTAGQAINLVLSFRAPAAPATVGVTSTVGTSTTESNTGNNSATGNLSVPTLQPTGMISGRVWYDANRNRRFDAGEVGRANWSVDLLQGGSPIARTSTDSNGQYSFTGLPDGVYAVRFMPWMGSGTLPVNGESGTAITGGGIPGQSILDNIVIANVGTRNFRLKIGGDVVTEQSLPIDPSGTVYDSSTRLPISGATVTLGYACGTVDPSWLVSGASTVTTGADGSYAFFLLPAAPSACNYTLTVSKAGYTSPSTVIPSSGSWSAGGGAVTGVSGAPSGAQATTYYLSGPKPTADVTNNNIPLDPQVVAAGASATAVPTLSTWAMLLMMSTMAALAWPGVARRRPAGQG